MNKTQFNAMVQRGPIILDGATGSNLRRAGMPAGVCTELWVLEHPEVLLELQRNYINAGSEIILAPTFSANRFGLSMHGLEDRLIEINSNLVALSKKAADGRAFVAGEITTTGKILEPVGDVSYQTLFDVYKEQISVLVDSGADLIIAETMISLEETMVALDAAQAVCDLPVMCSLTLESDGQLLYGGTAIEAVETLQEMGADAVGLNCSVGPDQLEAVIGAMKAVAKVPLIAKPNAGVPFIDEKGIAHYNMSAEPFAHYMKILVDKGAQIVGGCCGTDPSYIEALVKAVKNVGVLP